MREIVNPVVFTLLISHWGARKNETMVPTFVTRRNFTPTGENVFTGAAKVTILPTIGPPVIAIFERGDIMTSRRKDV